MDGVDFSSRRINYEKISENATILFLVELHLQGIIVLQWSTACKAAYMPTSAEMLASAITECYKDCENRD